MTYVKCPPYKCQKAHLLPPLGLILCLSAMLCATRTLAQTPDDRPFLVQTAANVDQNLFPLYVLRQMYRNLPEAKATNQEQMDWIATTKTEAQEMRAVIRDRRLDPGLDMMYQDCLDFTSAYETFLGNRGLIQKERDQHTLSDLLASTFKGFQNASDAKDVASSFGASSDNASSLGNVAGILSGLGDMYSRSQQRDAAENAAIAAEARKLSDTWTAVSTHAQVVSSRLAQTYGWNQAEGGFDGFSSQSPDGYVSRMPRNPFAVLEAATELKGDEHPDELLRRAFRCFHAAELVPSDSIYDGYRNLFIYESAALGVAAASAEAGERGYSAGPTPSSAYAVQLVRTYLSLNRADPGGAGNVLLARALGESGRYTEAVAADNIAFQIAPANQNDMMTAFRYAALLSLTGAADSSAQWVEKAYQLGFNDIDFVGRDPDLTNLRRARPEVFAQLTTARLTNPQFIWGLILDDAVVRNESDFDLTHVVVQVVVRKGNTTYPFTMQCQTIKAGGTCRVNNVVSIPGDSYDDLQATFRCDQAHR
jgi:hypothetical protein